MELLLANFCNKTKDLKNVLNYHSLLLFEKNYKYIIKICLDFCLGNKSWFSAMYKINVKLGRKAQRLKSLLI